MDIDRQAMEKQSATLTKAGGGKVGSRYIDLSDPEAVDAAFDGLDAKLGAPSILINNAGIALSAPFSKTDLEFWTKMIGIDLTGAFLCMRKVLPAMKKAGFGRIVNTVSTAGLKGYPYVTAYCAAKHGLLGLTRSLAVETAKTGVTVNAVCPGYADTDIVRGAIENIVAKTGLSEEEALAQLTSHNPQGRLIQPAEVAEAVIWLCRPESASVTGQAIVIAGGEIM
jgi:NAD(P)-dependent dehydrogenase (short-subunit alcohol dehydrogenase family)